MKAIIDKIEHLLCVASEAGKAEAAGDTATAERLDMELKRGVEAIEQALGQPDAWKCNPQCHARDCREAQACQRRDDPPCGHMLRGIRKNYCPRCQRAASGVAPARKITSLAEFCAEGERLGLTAADLAEALKDRPEFADCKPAAGVKASDGGDRG
jgi:hypothetical protein